MNSTSMMVTRVKYAPKMPISIVVYTKHELIDSRQTGELPLDLNISVKELYIISMNGSGKSMIIRLSKNATLQPIVILH